MKKLQVALALGLISVFVLGCVSAEAKTAEEWNQDTSITVTSAVLDADSPTGAYVTFRYPASDKIVRMAVGCDEMTFANPDGVDIAPEDWTKGSWVHSNVRTSTARDMELVGDYWTATWPATNGSLLYYFYVGEEGDDYVEAGTTKEFVEAAISAGKQYWDPQNEPAIASWETQLTFAANQRRSLIYVPRPEGFSAEDMLDLTLQDPNGTDEKGFVGFCQIPGTIDGEEAHINCSVYVPYGFDPNREEAYPLQVLYHGASGDYTQWVAHGAMDHIYDNAIAQGIIEPTVVVMPDGEDSHYDIEFIVNSILPYMQQNYNCSTDPAKLAMSGLSRGGMTTANMLQNHPDAFKYWGGFSGFGRANSRGVYVIDLHDPALQDIKLYIAYGDNDSAKNNCSVCIDKFALEPSIDMIGESLHGAHQMYVWRQALENFVRKVLWK